MSEDREDLPHGWVRTTIGEVVSPSVEQKAPGVSEEFTYVEISSIDNTQKIIVSPAILLGSKAPTRARQRLKTGDVLVSLTRPNLNAVALIPPKLEGAIGSTGFDVLRPLLVNPSWIFYTVQHPDFIAEMSRRVLGVVYPAIRPKDVRSYSFPLPPLAEQKRIIGEIEKQFTLLDTAVRALERIKTRLKHYRASVLKAAYQGRLVPNEAELARLEGRTHEPPVMPLGDDESESSANLLPGSGELPNGWTWASVGQLAANEPNSITDGPFGSNLKTSHYTDHGPRVIRLQNIGDGEFVNEEAHISESHYKSLIKHKTEAGDLVIAMLGDRLPRACIIPEWLGPAVVKADCVRFKPNSRAALSRYLNLALNAEPTRDKVSSLVHGVGRPRLNLREIKSILLPIPPLAEQARIADEADRRLSLLVEVQLAVNLALERAQVLRQEILRKAFKGDLAPQRHEDEPADVLFERIQAATRALQSKSRSAKPLRMTQKNSRVTHHMKDLLDVLIEAGEPLSPEALFDAAGFDRESVDSVDSFYEALKRHIELGSIAEKRSRRSLVKVYAVKQ